jgi:hypothetical protein
MLRLRIAAASLVRIGSTRKRRGNGYFEFPVTEVMACLKDEVCPAIAEVWHRSSFRNLVLMPHATLLPGIDSPARKLVDEIRRSLLEALEKLTIAMDGQADILTAAPQTTATADRRLLLGSLKQRAGELTELATQEWVSVDNFFQATRAVWKIHRIPIFDVAKKIRCREALGRGNHAAARIGNLIVRGMLFQIEDIIERFGELAREFKTDVMSPSFGQTRPWRPPVNAAHPLLDQLRFLTLSSEEGQNCESAMILTQIFSDAAVVKPDISWLGLRKSSSAWPTHGIRSFVACHRDYDLIDRMVLALIDIAEYYEQRPSNEAEIEDAIATGGLVVVEQAREVYWQMKFVDVQWNKHRKPWELMLRLAQTRGKGSVSEQDIYGQPMKESTFPNLRSDLGKLLPVSLDILIEPGELKSYRLCLRYDQFHLFPASYALEAAAG